MAANNKIDDYTVMVVQRDTVDMRPKTEEVLKEGWLQVKRDGKKFAKKYFVLRTKPNAELALYDKVFDKEKRKPLPKGTITAQELDGVKPMSSRAGKKPFAFEVSTATLTWILATESEEDKQFWLHFVRGMLSLAEEEDLELHAWGEQAKQAEDPNMPTNTTGF
jgi:PH domain